MSTRRCYYGKCTFCDNYIDYSKYYNDNSENIYKRVEYYYKLGIVNFAFIDDCVPPKILMEFSKKVIKNKLKINWTANVRAEYCWTNLNNCKLISDGGCAMLFLGIESLSQHVLNKMNKGYIVNNIPKIIQNLKYSNINIYCSFMIGFPGETIKDYMKTIKFLRLYWSKINLIDFNRFLLTQGSKINKNTDMFNIKKINDKKISNIKMFFEYEDFNNNALNNDEIKKEYNQILQKIINSNKYPTIRNICYYSIKRNDIYES